MEGHTKKIINLIRISAGTILSSSFDKSIKLWDTMVIFSHIFFKHMKIFPKEWKFGV